MKAIKLSQASIGMFYIENSSLHSVLETTVTLMSSKNSVVPVEFENGSHKLVVLPKSSYIYMFKSFSNLSPSFNVKTSFRI